MDNGTLAILVTGVLALAGTLFSATYVTIKKVLGEIKDALGTIYAAVEDNKITKDELDEILSKLKAIGKKK